MDTKIHIYFLQHPQIQKKSQYIKYLCCDDVRTLHQWVNGIRIAKVCSGLFSRQKGQNIVLREFMLINDMPLCLCVVWEAAVCELPRGHEEDRGGLRLVLSLYLQHPIRLQFCQHTWSVHRVIRHQYNRFQIIHTVLNVCVCVCASRVPV